MLRRTYKTLFALPGLLLWSAAAWAEQVPGEAHYPGGLHDPVSGFNHLWKEVMIDITIIGLIFSLVTIYMLIRYRRKYDGQEGKQPKLTMAAALGWALIPVFIFMADDFFIAAEGWTLWNKYRNVPEDHYEIKLEAQMWTWNFEYPGGVKATNDLRVPVGKPIVMRMTSRDVVHSLFLPDFRVKEDSMPGRVTYLWFLPKEPGEHVLTCAEYCGVLHSNMQGKLIVMTEADFNAWYEAEKAKLSKGGA